MTDNSIDIQPFPQEAEVPVRKYFRVPVSGMDKIQAIFNDKTFAVTDISATGIAVYSESCLEFEAGQILNGFQLWLGKTRLEGLTGKVVHCSVHESGQLYFGIEWQNMAADKQKRLGNVLEEIKSRILKAGGQP